MLRGIVVAAYLVCFASVCVAEKSPVDSASKRDYHDFLTLEATVVITSWMASEDPKATGNALLVLSPLFLGDGKDFLSVCAISCTVVAMGLYNLKLDEDEVEERNVFRNNIIGWNVFMAGYYVYEIVSQNGNPNRATYLNRAFDLNLLALREGGLLQLSVRF